MLSRLTDRTGVRHPEHSGSKPTNIIKKLVFDSLLGCDSFGRVIGEQLSQQIYQGLRSIGQQFIETNSLFLWKIELIGAHVSGPAFKELNQGGLGSAQHLIDLMDLVKFPLSIKKGVLGDHLKQHAAIPPDIHLGVIVAVSHEAFRGPVPSRADVLSVGLLGIDTLMSVYVPLQLPKSASLMLSPEISTFSGLMSRWKMPLL